MKVGFDFVNAKVRAMRSMLYEGERLRALSELRTPGDLLSALFPDRRIAGILDLERSLVEAHAADLLRVWRHLGGGQADFFLRLLERYPVENLKVILRGAAAGERAERIRELVVELPGPLALPLDELIAARENPSAVAGLLAGGRLAALVSHAADPVWGDPFGIDSALDAGYLEGLVEGLSGLSRGERRAAEDLVTFEVDAANVMVALRARLNYELEPAAVVDMFIEGAARVRRGAWLAFLSDPSAGRAGYMLGITGEAAASIESLEWLSARRLWELACRRFRTSVLDYGTAVAFFYIKRTELANLLRLAGAISYELDPQTLRAGLIGAGERRA